MKNFLMILGLTLLVTTSGCMRPGTMGGGRGSMMAGGYGTAGGMGNPMMGGGGMGGTMMGTPGMTPGVLPVGARGRVMAYGGSVYMGTGYVNPELTMMAAGRRADLMAASAAVPSTPMTSSPCADGSCPTPVEAAPADSALTERVEAIEDQLLADHTH